MPNETSKPFAKLWGYAAITGGVLGLLLAPIMVIIKYMTGWAIIPEPAWIAWVKPALGTLLSFAAPPILWTTYGSFYTLALLLMLVGLFALAGELRDAAGKVQTKGYWVLLAGFCLVIPSDLIHSITWHQNGLTTPKPGTNIVANTAYAVHMMGMNLVLLGALITGIAALRRKFLSPLLAWLFVLLFPAAVLASVTVLPTSPSGGLWLFCVTMILFGGSLVQGKKWHHMPPSHPAKA